jgi:multiple sugar transport system ATP-binding protein
MSEITLERVTKTFPDGTVAIRDVDFTIRDGEFFILVGPSGCGKSTLLNMIVGLEGLTEGEIRVDGEVVNDVDPKDRNMAMVFQSYAIYPHMSVRENMAFPLKLAKVPKDEIGKRVEQAAAVLELTEHLDRKPGSLSGGQRQRVAMGRAIVREPRAFLLDEPLSNLDAKLRVQMRTETALLHHRLGTTMVYVTHDQTEAMTLGDRIAVLRRGVVQQIGTPRELYQEPANLFVAGFIGSPSMNFFPAHLEDDRLELPMISLELHHPWRNHIGAKARRLLAGIRPEHFEDASLSEQRSPTFTATVEVLEWMGSELDVHFPIKASVDDQIRTLAQELDIDLGTGEQIRVCARLGTNSRANKGGKLDLRIDSRHLHLFDPETGERLRPSGATVVGNERPKR